MRAGRPLLEELKNAMSHREVSYSGNWVMTE
jgi:hypothetical protein